MSRHGMTCQKTQIYSNTTVRTSGLKSCLYICGKSEPIWEKSRFLGEVEGNDCRVQDQSELGMGKRRWDHQGGHREL
jgi:hypothetical protein